MIARSRFLGISNTNNSTKIRQNSKSLFNVSIGSRISRLMKENGSKKSRWAVPLILPSPIMSSGLGQGGEALHVLPARPSVQLSGVPQNSDGRDYTPIDMPIPAPTRFGRLPECRGTTGSHGSTKQNTGIYVTITCHYFVSRAMDTHWSYRI
jgi:hypothetical protein